MFVSTLIFDKYKDQYQGEYFGGLVEARPFSGTFDECLEFAKNFGSRCQIREASLLSAIPKDHLTKWRFWKLIAKVSAKGKVVILSEPEWRGVPD